MTTREELLRNEPNNLSCFAGIISKEEATRYKLNLQTIKKIFTYNKAQQHFYSFLWRFEI